MYPVLIFLKLFLILQCTVHSETLLIHFKPIFSENNEKDDSMEEDKIGRVIVK